MGLPRVELHDDALARPHTVALHAGGEDVQLRPRQPVSVEEGEERGLEVALGVPGSGADRGKHLTDRRRAAVPRVSREQVIERKHVAEPAVPGFPHRALDLVRRHHGREVELGTRDRGRRDASTVVTSSAPSSPRWVMMPGRRHSVGAVISIVDPSRTAYRAAAPRIRPTNAHFDSHGMANSAFDFHDPSLACKSARGARGM